MHLDDLELRNTVLATFFPVSKILNVPFVIELKAVRTNVCSCLHFLLSRSLPSITSMLYTLVQKYISFLQNSSFSVFHIVHYHSENEAFLLLCVVLTMIVDRMQITYCKTAAEEIVLLCIPIQFVVVLIMQHIPLLSDSICSMTV